MLLYASAKWSAAKRGPCMHIYLRSGQCSTREQKACSKAMILRKEARLTSSRRLPSPKRFSSRYVQRAAMCCGGVDDPLPACFAGRARAGRGGGGGGALAGRKRQFDWCSPCLPENYARGRCEARGW